MASAVSTMRATMLLKDAASPSAPSAKSYALGVNRTYSRHFAVLEITADASSVTGK